MRPWQHKLYRLTSQLSSRAESKISVTGRYLILLAAAAALFGLNTRETMLYQLAALLIVMLVVCFPLSFFFTTSLYFRRILPETCTAGEKLTYVLQLENRGGKTEKGLFYRERSGAVYPTFEEFDTGVEAGEQQRNRIDRKLGYYRWLWLIENKKGAVYPSSPLPELSPGEKRDVEVSFLPMRRGYLAIGGYIVSRTEPMGLFKKELLFVDEKKILVLPRLYPVASKEMSGSRKYHQGGVTSALGSGDSGEFVSLRDYRPGDPIKHIDWKGTARSGSVVVRQFQNEYFSRYGIVLDTFSEGGDRSAIFEEAVSVAASIILHQDVQNNIIDLLFAGDDCISTMTAGRGMEGRMHLLEVLACVSLCSEKDFSELTGQVMSHSGVLSGLILVLMDLDEPRKELIDYLRSIGVPAKVVLVSEDRARAEWVLAGQGISNGVVFDMKSETRQVVLT